MHNLLIKIKNAQAVKKETVKAAFSRMNSAILKILEKFKYIEAASLKSGFRKNLEVKLAYKNNKGAIHNFKILSKPSRRLYIPYRKIRPVKQGYGILVLSTPKGIMDGETAKKLKVGGQLLFEIW